MADRGYKSIGEALAAIQDEFPDITISKIRFLESQGLLDPERTPSGYRKFSEADISQLVWILRQQRDQFLPLKVIKSRLTDGSLDQDGSGEPSAPPADRPPLEVGTRDVAISGESLCDATGLTMKQLRELERYGLIEAATKDGSVVYDADALAIGRTAAAFLAHGMEPRHLKAYKSAADREAGLFEQLAMPLARGGGGSPQRSAELLGQLVGLGEDMRQTLLRRALRSAHLPS